MASQFGFKTEMMLFANDSKRMLSHALLPVAEVLGRITDINKTAQNLKKVGVNIKNANVLPPEPKPKLPTLPAALTDINLDAYEKIHQAEVKQEDTTALISANPKWTTNKSIYETYRKDRSTALKDFSKVKLYFSQLGRENELLEYYKHKMTTFPFEQNFASDINAVYDVMRLDNTDDCTKEVPLLPASRTNQQLEALYRAKIVADIEGNNIIKSKLNTILPQGQTPETDLQKFIQSSQIYKAVNSGQPKIDTNTLDYELDIQPFVLVSHSIVYTSKGIAALNADNPTLNAQLSKLKDAIVQYKKAEKLEDITKGEEQLETAYKGLTSTVSLNIVGFEKTPESSKMYLSSPVEIKGKDIKDAFKITDGVANDMLSIDITLNQFEFDFDTKAMAVEVKTIPNKDFILNKYPKIFQLNYVKVTYVNTGNEPGS